MNWRDPRTDLVHIVNYSDNSAMAWSIRARTEGGNRWMCCGHEVKVTRDGFLDWESPVLVSFSHTNDMPTCLACIVWTPDTVLEDYARIAGYDPGDDEDDQDPLDRDGKA